MKFNLKAAIAALSLGAVTLTAAPAMAQRHDDHRDRAAWSKDRYDRDDRRGDRDWKRDGRHDNGRHNGQWKRPGRTVYNYDWNRPDPRYGRSYRPDRYYRTGYEPIRVNRNMRIYRGYDDRYYCRRSDGTTGLIVGAALGGLLGNQLDRGGSSLLTTLIGGGAGALLGREIDRGGVSCR
ncbi:glycine zipper 2TM domain-containing protein [Sphingobium bisphenolivorans]|uniref:glycine zipper 2TM domain-containing protein n=1 Tax=Sphingobium bisphenolivorans TaxID=1335760 RepID=UPI0003A6C0B8|nr:glycine zipper 2TM domain-containing protein [Sphingobium bisphenolivorans]